KTQKNKRRSGESRRSRVRSFAMRHLPVKKVAPLAALILIGVGCSSTQDEPLSSATGGSSASGGNSSLPASSGGQDSGTGGQSSGTGGAENAGSGGEMSSGGTNSLG